MTDFPFLTDDATVHHVITSRVMFVMRGLPGSGKSTIVRLIQDKYQHDQEGVVVCSADDHFLQEDGTYHFEQVGAELLASDETSQFKFTFCLPIGLQKRLKAF